MFGDYVFEKTAAQYTKKMMLVEMCIRDRKDIMTTVSGQFIIYNDANNQYYIDVDLSLIHIYQTLFSLRCVRPAYPDGLHRIPDCNRMLYTRQKHLLS